MTSHTRLVVVSHPAVLPVNQLVYAELSGRGWTVDVVVPDRWRHEYGEVVPEPLPTLAGRYHRLPVVMAGRPQRHAYRVRPAAVLRRLHPDVVFVEQEPFSIAALQWGQAAHRVGVPFGVQADENLDRLLPAPVRVWRSWVLRHAAFVAARSERAGQLVKQWGAAGDVRLVPHHVPEWTPSARSVSDRFRVGFAGRLVPEKGLDVLVGAVRRLGSTVELVVAGDGPLREWLEHADLGGASLRLLTGLTHGGMADAYALMDVLVLPSRTTDTWAEQFGRVLVEALSCGVPVVGSDSGEIPWVIAVTGGGRVVPEGDVEALANVLSELKDDEQQRGTLARSGRESVVQTFSVPAVADALGKVLGDATGGGERGGSTDGRPKVALVAHGVHDAGGMERACAELIRQKHLEVAFTIVATELAPELRPLVERWVRVRVPLRPIPVKFVAFFMRSWFVLRHLDVDLIHTVGAIVPNQVDVAAVHYCHAGHRAATKDFAPVDAPLNRRMNTALARALALIAERWCYRPSRLRSFAAVSEGVAAEVSTHYPGIPVVVTPNGIDTGRFYPDPEQRYGLRRQHRLGAAQCVVLFVGGDWDRKGLALAMEAVAKARADGADVHLWVVGPGDRHRFAGLAAQLGIATHVSFFGQRDDPQRYYQAADIFVLPSAYETFSIVCFEAAACGLPLIIPPIHGADRLVGVDQAGVIVDRDAASIAGAVVCLARDAVLRARLGGEAARRARSFTWEESAGTVTDLYRHILEGDTR